MSRFSDAIKAGGATEVQTRQLFTTLPIVWRSVRNLVRDVRGAGIHQETGDGIIALGDRNCGAVCKAEEALVICLSSHADNLSDRNRDGVAGTVAAEQVEFNKAHFHTSFFSKNETICEADRMHKNVVASA